MNAIELLKSHHVEVSKLFSRFEKAKRADDKVKIFDQIATRLVAHDAIEREIFYPACERAAGKSDPLMEGITEHGLIEFSLFRADRARGKDTFEYLVTVLQENIEHHVEEEEKELFPAVKKKIGAEKLAQLGETMEARFNEALGQDFRKPLRANLEQVISGRVKTAPAKRAPKRTTRAPKPTARAGSPKRATRASEARA